jgi:hypothetical protein
MNRIVYLFAVLLGLASGWVPARGQEPFGFQLDRRLRSTRIPFQLHSNLIIVPVRINQSDTLRFILDTGVSTNIITDPKVPVARSLRRVRSVKITGAGEGGALSASVSLGNTLRIGQLTGFNQSILVLDQDVLQISEYVGVPIHGIFGYEIFNQFVVTIDFSNHEIILEQPSRYRYRKSKGERHPITIEDAKPYLSAIALVEKNRTVPIKVIIDTGAGHALSLDVSGRTEIRQPQKVVRAQLGRGLSGVINGSLGRVEKIRIGNFELDNLLACFPDSIAYGMKLDARDDRQGNIGCELLRRFRVTFNYHEQYIVLKPVKRRFREAFEHNMSGMELIARGQDFKEFIVDRVLEDSPAEAAGLEAGDQLISINGQYCRNLTISDVQKLLQKGDGREIVLIVRRGAEILATSFALKRVI